MRYPPWLDSFFYFDQECQLIFDIGRIYPVVIFNYLNFQPDPDLMDMIQNGGSVPGFFIEPHTPIPEIEIHINENSSSLRITINNPRDLVLPYGIFLWNEAYPDTITFFENISQIPNEITWKISPDQGVFLRMDLQPGSNQFIIN